MSRLIRYKVWIRPMRGDECWSPVCGYHNSMSAAHRRASRIKSPDCAAVVVPVNQSPNKIENPAPLNGKDHEG